MTPQKYPHTPKNINFSKNPPKIELENFEPKQMTRAYVCMKCQSTPPPPGANVSNKGRGLKLHLYQFFVWVSSIGYGKTADARVAYLFSTKTVICPDKCTHIHAR